MKKKLLMFAHYYYPDVASTGQILQDLAEGMTDRFEITVICTVPSYSGTIEEAYRNKKYYFEQINGVRIIRVRVPEFSKENKISRIKNILAYFFRAIAACKKAGGQDAVFTISQPPILGGLLGVIGKWMKRAKLVYCIQDFNPEQICAVNYSSNRFVVWVMKKLDIFSCGRSDLIITVGRDLVETVKNRFVGKKCPKTVMINNWIDEKMIYPLSQDAPEVLQFKEKYGLAGKYVVMYSGNIGLYYDLENIMKVIETFRDRTDVVFAFVGAGAKLETLKKNKEDKDLANVVFIPYQDKADLNASLNSGDIHWCVNAKGIKGVSCPSKFYGIAAINKPILGVLEQGTEIRTLIEEIGCGEVCDPGDYPAIEAMLRHAIENKPTQINSRDYVEKNLSKECSISKYKDEISKL